MGRVLVSAHRSDLAALEALRQLEALRHLVLPDGVTLVVDETAGTTPCDSLPISVIRHETPSPLRLKADNPKAWYRQFERRARK